MTPDLLPARMAAKVRVTEQGCWEWTAALQSSGYGCTGIGNRRVGLAHRVAYELLVGPIPAGLQIDHLCRNKRCVNPAHLEPVTASENQRRARSLITHCPKGHEYTPENTVIVHGRQRNCRECTRAYKRAWDRRRRTTSTP